MELSLKTKKVRLIEFHVKFIQLNDFDGMKVSMHQQSDLVRVSLIFDKVTVYSKNKGQKLYVSLIIATNGRLTEFTEEKVLLLRVPKNIAIKLPKLKVFGFLKAGLAPKFPGPVGIGIVRK